MISAIKRAAKDRGISRLCHFTPSRNLPGIAANETGILATRYLREDELAIFTATDALRLDGYADHVSCSIEYPNAWYLAKAEQNDRIFKDWVILFIRPHYLWEEGTRFCPRNAAALGGTLVSSGFEAFESLFARKVRGAYNRLQTRTELHLPCCTTDDQAEVLVPDSIPLSDLIGVAVRNEAQAKREASRLHLLEVAHRVFNFDIAPTLFCASSLSQAIRRGRRPIETAWKSKTM